MSVESALQAAHIDSFAKSRSHAVAEPLYRQLDGERLRFPDEKSLCPEDELLEIHMKSYNSQQRKLGLSCA